MTEQVTRQIIRAQIEHHLGEKVTQDVIELSFPDNCFDECLFSVVVVVAEKPWGAETLRKAVKYLRTHTMRNFRKRVQELGWDPLKFHLYFDAE